jgi:hypothetical protein
MADAPLRAEDAYDSVTSRLRKSDSSGLTLYVPLPDLGRYHDRFRYSFGCAGVTKRNLVRPSGFEPPTVLLRRQMIKGRNCFATDGFKVGHNRPILGQLAHKGLICRSSYDVDFAAVHGVKRVSSREFWSTSEVTSECLDAELSTRVGPRSGVRIYLMTKGIRSRSNEVSKYIDTFQKPSAFSRIR